MSIPEINPTFSMLSVTAGTSDIGLQHVIEDALALLKGGAIDAGRKSFVISDLKELFELASRGSDLAEQSQLFSAARDISAYENFSLVRMHVQSLFNGKLREMLRDVCVVFTLLDADQRVPDDKRNAAIQFLAILLQRVSRDRSSLQSVDSASVEMT